MKVILEFDLDKAEDNYAFLKNELKRCQTADDAYIALHNIQRYLDRCESNSCSISQDEIRDIINSHVDMDDLE